MVRRLPIIILAAFFLDGCKIARDQVNIHVRDIDTSWIEPGVTTRRHDEDAKRSVERNRAAYERQVEQMKNQTKS